MATLDPEQKRAAITKLVKLAIIAVGAAVTAPLAFYALEGVVAWAAFGGAVLLISNFAPVIGAYVANKRIQALVAVIEANPIETMQNLYADKQSELAQADQNIVEFETEIGNFDDQVETFKTQYPDEASSYQELSAKMHEALTGAKQGQSAARGELVKFKLSIDKAQAIYRMSGAANRMVRLSQAKMNNVYADIKEKVAFDKVRTNLNTAFANLNLALERRKDAQSFLAAPAEKAALPPASETPAIPVPTRALASSVRR